jgi:hypothetical protein
MFFPPPYHLIPIGMSPYRFILVIEIAVRFSLVITPIEMTLDTLNRNDFPLVIALLIFCYLSAHSPPLAPLSTVKVAVCAVKPILNYVTYTHRYASFSL